MKNGLVCNNNSKISINGNFRCLTHISKDVKEDIRNFKIDQENKIKARMEIERVKKEAERKRINDLIISHIKSVYEKAKNYRKVPPDERIAFSLLAELQDEKCLICQNDGYLVEDHCHKTGMVRGLLCRSCNVMESNDYREPWLTYREFAPANGWFYRYSGYGEQWRPGYPDPLPNRMVLDIEIKDFRTGEIDKKIEMYKRKIKRMKPTEIPYTCYRFFDILNKPILFDNEKWIRVYDSQKWPIITIKPLPDKIKTWDEIQAEDNPYENHAAESFA